MLELTDAATGDRVTVGARRVVRIAVPQRAGSAGPHAVRALVVADALRRYLELRGRVPRFLADPAAAGGPADLLALNVPPLTAEPDDPGGVGASPEVVVAAGEPGEPLGRAACWLRVGPARWPQPGPGVDPLALRWALLGRRYAEPVELTAADLDAAQAELTAWRAAVAGWADAPSGPLPREHVDRALAAVADDLDTPATLAALGALRAAGDVPPGARFEACAYLDRVLAVDLARNVGRG